MEKLEKNPIQQIQWICQIIDKLKEAKYFNKLNLIWGYNNVQIKEGDK